MEVGGRTSGSQGRLGDRTERQDGGNRGMGESIPTHLGTEIVLVVDQFSNFSAPIQQGQHAWLNLHQAAHRANLENGGIDKVVDTEEWVSPSQSRSGAEASQLLASFGAVAHKYPTRSACCIESPPKTLQVRKIIAREREVWEREAQLAALMANLETERRDKTTEIEQWVSSSPNPLERK